PSATGTKTPSILTVKPIKPASSDDELRKLLIARYNSAVKEMEGRYRAILGHGSLDDLVDVAHRVVVSALEVSKNADERISYREKYLELTKEVEKRKQALFDSHRITAVDLENARYRRLDAEIQLAKEKRRANSFGMVLPGQEPFAVHKIEEK